MLRNLMSSKIFKKSHSGNINYFEPIPPAFVPEIGDAETDSKKSGHEAPEMKHNPTTSRFRSQETLCRDTF